MTAQRNKKIPLRKCIACGEMKTKEELVRFVMKNGEVLVDKTFKAGGRGAYICKNEKCIDLAKKKKAFERTLSVKIADDFYELLKKEL